jgi:hypothetical protein
MHIKNFYLIICFLAVMSSCQKTPLETALQRAGKNSNELQKVLEHYSVDDADSLKYQAAVFLIENMVYHFGIEQTIYQNSQEVDEFSWGKHNLSHTLPKEKVKEERNRLINEAIDSLGIYIKIGDAIWDIENITSRQLIENIDYAFKAWEMPWSKHLTFSEFCEYILPYRCQTEPLTRWRKYFFDKYSWIKDSLPKDCDPLSACVFLRNQLKLQLIYSNNHSPFYQGYLPPRLFEKVQIGACENLSSYTSLIMRSIGIPVLYDQVLIWRNKNVGHAYNWVVTNDSVGGYYFGAVDKGQPSKKLKIIGRVFRKTYQIQENTLWNKFLKGEQVPPGLWNTYQKDVTHLYCRTEPLTMKLKDANSIDHLYYLCQITKSKGLKALNHSAVDNQKQLHFINTTTHLVYILGTYNSGYLKPVSNPFYFTEDGIFDINGDMNSLTDYKFEREFWKIEKHSVQENDKLYQVEYWNNGNWTYVPSKWRLQKVSIQENKGEDKQKLLYTIELSNVPQGALFKFQRKNYWSYSPFTFDQEGKYQSLLVNERDLQPL